MLFAFGKQVVPSSDQTALVLIVHHLQLVHLPSLTHLRGGGRREGDEKGGGGGGGG